MACSNGSEPKPGSPPYFLVDSKETTCALWGQESAVCKYISWAPFGGLITAIVETGSFCSSPPVYPDPLTIGDFTNNIWIGKAIALAKAYAWSKYCKCKDKSGLPPGDTPFQGGQCAHYYRVEMTRQVNFGADVNQDDFSNRDEVVEGTGPISSIKVVVTPPGSSSQWKAESQVKFSNAIAIGPMGVSASEKVCKTFKILSIKITDLSGQPDNCGDLPEPPPPPQDEPDPPPPLPPPPSDLPEPPPSSPGPKGPPGPEGPPGKDADPCIPCKDGVDGLPGMDGKQGPQGVAGSTGQMGAQGEAGQAGATGPKGDTGSSGKDAEVEFVNIIVPIIDCNDYAVIETLRVIQVIKGTEDQVKLAHQQAAAIAIQQCEAGPPVAAIADWWQVRLNSNVPQLVVVFGPTSSNNYHHICIPHPIDTTKRINSPLQAYGKGSWQGQVICKDNSKFTINCGSAADAQLMCSEAIAAIDPAFLESPPRVHISERKGQAVIEENLYPNVLMYFPTGQRQTMPEWRTKVVFT